MCSPASPRDLRTCGRTGTLPGGASSCLRGSMPGLSANRQRQPKPERGMARLMLAIGLALALASPALANPQKFTTEENATKFCKQGNVVWLNSDSKIYFEPGSRNYGKTKEG